MITTPISSGKTKNLTGLPQLVIGIVGMSLFGIASLVFLILSLSMKFKVFWILFASFAVIFATSSVMTAMGAKKRKLSKRLQNYYHLLEIRRVMQVDELAAGTGRSPRLIRKDIRDARKYNMIHDLWTDEKMLSVILGRDAYQHFLENEKNRRQQESNERERAMRLHNPATAALEEFRKEGAVAISQIRTADDIIKDETISKKLSSLEIVILAIFDYIEKHPDNLLDVRRFMQYYLPAALQLLDRYRQYHEMALQPSAVLKAGKEIENALDMIIVSFNNLLNSLYHFETLDVRADIDVLENMLSQEGLTGDQFAANLIEQ